MSLPNLPAGDKFRREVRTEWGGINLNENASDGELIEAVNMSSREFPLLANARFIKTEAENAMNAPYVYAGKLGYEYMDNNPYGVGVYLHDPTHPTASILVDGVQIISGSPQYTKQYAIMGTRICMFGADNHHKRIYDFSTGVISDIGAEYTHTMALEDAIISIQDGIYAGVAAEGNTIYKAGVDWGSIFQVGDGVTISGCLHEGNNKSVIIREIDEDYLRFYENTFENERVPEMVRITVGAISPGTYVYFTSPVDSKDYEWTPQVRLPKGTKLGLYWDSGDGAYVITYEKDGVTYSSTAQYVAEPSGYHQVFSANTFSVKREVPDLDFVCVNENRMWGCKGDTIYCSKLGDPLNWNVYDGLSTDSWATETGTPGDFTGCCSYQGYPTFFKENAVFKVLGDEPKNFTLRKQNIMGVKKNADKTIVEIRGKLYYLSRAGVMEWNGGDYPTIISGALGIEPGMASQLGSSGAGTDTVRYYIELKPFYYDGNENIPWEVMMGVFVYDTRYGTWHMLDIDGIPQAYFTGDGTYNWMLKDYPYGTPSYPMIYQLGVFSPDWDTTTEWRVTFADSTRAFKTALTGSESKKGVLRLLIRCRLAGSMKVWIAYDGGEFEEAAEFTAMEKTSKVVPLILRRCDFWQLRLTGTGDAVIYSIAVERYGGEWQQA